MDWFLYDNDLRHERVNTFMTEISNPILFKVNIILKKSSQQTLHNLFL